MVEIMVPFIPFLLAAYGFFSVFIFSLIFKKGVGMTLELQKSEAKHFRVLPARCPNNGDKERKK